MDISMKQQLDRIEDKIDFIINSLPIDIATTEDVLALFKEDENDGK